YSEEVSNEKYLGLTDADFRQNPMQRYGASALDRMENHRTSIAFTHIAQLLPSLSITTTAYRSDFARVWRKANHFRSADLYEVLRDP
ncbi:hypothetical protein, partial [Rhizobium leguminosarum]|uniref:hypothetical protein n=1 Tax=Rhizobium leguminosarum TaxID=384 RepID=UPI003F9C5ABB